MVDWSLRALESSQDKQQEKSMEKGKIGVGEQ
jgi:hypothetical protein